MSKKLDKSPEADALFEFPCRFPIKILGSTEEDLLKLVQATLREELKDTKNMEFTDRLSEKDNYRSVTAIFTAHSREELDRIYQKLSQHKSVKWMV